VKSVNLNAINATQQPTAQRTEPGRQASAEAKPAPVSRGADQIRVSSTAAQVANLVARAKGTPDVRQDRVDSLRELVHSGRYEVPANDIAAAILRDEK
jgi:flagellar biosynthesis anti-sigma factor FlgM